MKRIIFIIASVFFILTVYVFSTVSCSNSFKADFQREPIKLILPTWPPDMENNEIMENNKVSMYPELSRWIVTIKSGDMAIEKILSPEDKEIEITALKNRPLTVTAQPVTLNSEKKETIIFKPAGYIYPYEYKKENKITWENGYIADVMKEVFNNKKEEIDNFIMNFNWKKAQEYINTNSANIENYYNPWLIDREKLITRLYSGSFSSIYLKSSYTYQYELDKLNNAKLLSTYIPENKIIKETGKILLKKDSSILFYNTKDKGTLFTLESSKKLLQQHIFLPIYMEGL